MFQKLMDLFSDKNKQNQDTREKSTVRTEPVSSPDAKTKPGKNLHPSKNTFLNKYAAFIDKLIIVLSLWLAIAVLIFHGKSLPEFGLHKVLDNLLMFLIIFGLTYLTLRLLRVLVYIGVLVSILYLIGILFIDVYEEYRDPRKTEKKIQLELKEDSNLLNSSSTVKETAKEGTLNYFDSNKVERDNSLLEFLITDRL